MDWEAQEYVDRKNSSWGKTKSVALSTTFIGVFSIPLAAAYLTMLPVRGTRDYYVAAHSDRRPGGMVADLKNNRFIAVEQPTLIGSRIDTSGGTAHGALVGMLSMLGGIMGIGVNSWAYEKLLERSPEGLEFLYSPTFSAISNLFTP
jgi:hypothetical protein